MQRRRFLAAGGIAALAGCVGGQVRPTGTATPTVAAPSGAGPTGEVDLPVPEAELVRGAGTDNIPAITDPVFGPDWSSVEVDTRTAMGERFVATPRLTEGSRVIGVERGGEARAYPLAMLNWHEVVNDTLDGPLLVTYCPLCGSGMAAERTVGGQPATFGVSGLLYRNDLVMYDEPTGSLWSQILATAIRGPKTGETLSLVPAQLTTWGAWRATHDDAVVLRPPPESNTVVGRDATRNYGRNPYAGYELVRAVGIGGSYEDERLHPKTMVLGVSHDGVARAYPLDRVLAAGAVNDTVGGLPVVVSVAPGDTLVGYERRVDGRVLEFAVADERHLAAGGSRWRTATGVAVDGPYAGERLRPATGETPMFFFAWLNFSSGTEVYGD